MLLLKVIWKKWQGVAIIIGNFQSQVILSLFYLILLSVIGIIFSFFGDPLSIKNKKSNSKKRSNFNPWEHKEDSLETAKKQF